MKTLTKNRVTNIVSAYKELFPDEYRLGVLANKTRQHNQTRWGEVRVAQDMGREITRMPDTLQMSLQSQLTGEQYDELYSPKGILWFLRTYPEWSPNQERE
jgi:hypothetical protein